MCIEKNGRLCECDSATHMRNPFKFVFVEKKKANDDFAGY